MRQVNRQTDITPARTRKSAHAQHVDHFAPETSPYLTEDYFVARDRRRQADRKARWRKSITRRLSIAGAAAVAGIVTFGVLTDGGSRLSTPKALHGDLERLAIAAGFGINQVALSGHGYTSEDDIFDALDLPNMHSFLSFEPSILRERLQRLPWIKTVEASRIYPGQLKIHVTERQPAAVWQRGGQDYLIDDGGRVLTAVEPGVLDHLPRLRGEGAAAHVGQLFALMQRFPDVAGFVTVSERVGERRWTMKLVGGGALHLPADQEASALNAFLAHDCALDLVQSGNAIVDLRADGRITIRPIVPATRMSARVQDMG